MLLRLIIFLLFLVTTAQIAAAQDDKVATHTRELAACNRKLDAGQFKRRIEYAVCLNLANAKMWAGTPHWDLFENAAARDLAAAEAFDQGRMTEIQYRAVRAKIKSDLISEAHRRDAYRAAIRPPPQGPITCFTFGQVTNCY
jgi:hypothetical protein